MQTAEPLKDAQGARRTTLVSIAVAGLLLDAVLRSLLLLADPSRRR